MIFQTVKFTGIAILLARASWQLWPSPRRERPRRPTQQPSRQQPHSSSPRTNAHLAHNLGSSPIPVIFSGRLRGSCRR